MRAITCLFFAVATFLLGDIAQSAQWEAGRDVAIVGWLGWGVPAVFIVASIAYAVVDRETART